MLWSKELPPPTPAATQAAPAPDARTVATQVADNHWREVVEDERQEDDGHRGLQRAPVCNAVQQRVRQRGLAGTSAQDDREQGQEDRGQSLQGGSKGEEQRQGGVDTQTAAAVPCAVAPAAGGSSRFRAPSSSTTTHLVDGIDGAGAAQVQQAANAAHKGCCRQERRKTATCKVVQHLEGSKQRKVC